MKYSPKQYAEALWEAVKNKKGKEMEKMTDNFFALLKKNNDSGLAGKISKEFEEIVLREEGVFRGEIIFARNMDAKVKHAIEKKLIDRRAGDIKAKEIRWSEKTDKELIGGFVARIDEVLIDASMKTTLEKMKRELKTAIN